MTVPRPGPQRGCERRYLATSTFSPPLSQRTLVAHTQTQLSETVTKWSLLYYCQNTENRKDKLES